MTAWQKSRADRRQGECSRSAAGLTWARFTWGCVKRAQQCATPSKRTFMWDCSGMKAQQGLFSSDFSSKLARSVTLHFPCTCSFASAFCSHRKKKAKKYPAKVLHRWNCKSFTFCYIHFPPISGCHGCANFKWISSLWSRKIASYHIIKSLPYHSCKCKSYAKSIKWTKRKKGKNFHVFN